MERAIIYLRCSTATQTNSLEIQERLARQFCSRFGYEVHAVNSEVASGKDNDRPVFRSCVQQCLNEDLVLISTKIDRLARKISAIGALIDSGVRLRIVSMGDQPVSKMVLAVFSAMAEQERDFISMRTKEALAHLKSQGVQLGNPRLDDARKAAVASNKRSADVFRSSMLPVVQQLKEDGLTTYKEIAETLNRLGYNARRGGRFHPSSVRALITG